MQLTITSADTDHVAQLDVDAQHRVDSIAPQLQDQFGIPMAQQVLLFNGAPVRQDASFEAAGIKADDLLVITRSSNSPAAPAFPVSNVARPGMHLQDIPPNASPELLLDIMEKNPRLLLEIQHSNPKLAQALQTKNVSDVRMALLEMYMESASQKFQEQEEITALERNPFDTEAQAKIEERIRLSNVQKNMEIAIEEMPEAFARVYMLYIPCEVNGVAVKSFVDSGAQSTIMSSSCAERCGIMRLVDKRFAGQAVGVGTAKIIGRVHMAPLKIGDCFYNCSFTILDQQSVDFLFGLDMLKRHQCCIDLHKNVLRLRDGSESHEVPFLSEHEIPVSDQPVPGELPGTVGTPSLPTPAAPPAVTDPPAQSPVPQPASPAPSSSSGLESEADKIQRLLALGFDEQRAIAALQSTNGNVDLAAGLLFDSMN